MAYVQPCGTIELYRNVPLTPDYKDTLYFPTEQAQRNYFVQHRSAQFTNQMYTRVHQNKVRVNSKADVIMGSTYMAFNNNYTPAKWFYAFIDEIEYVNENVVEITYILDNVQTWFMQVNWNSCFIERQHSTTDVAGDNLQPEPLHPENYKAYYDIDRTVRIMSNPVAVHYIVVLGTFTFPKSSYSLFSTTRASGYLSLLKYLYFDSATDVINFINKCDIVEGGLYSTFSDGDLWDLIGIYAVPAPLDSTSRKFFNLDSESTVPLAAGGGSVTLLSQYAQFFEITSGNTGFPRPVSFGDSGLTTYVPKNKKLLTYPYTYFQVDTPTKTQKYRYEFFPDAIRFYYCGGVNPEPYMLIYPKDYMDDENNYQYAITVDDFPKLSTYQNGVMNGLGQALGAGIKSIAEATKNLAITLFANTPEAVIPSASTAIVPQGNIPSVISPNAKNAISNIINNTKSAYTDASQDKSIPDLRDVINRLGTSGGVTSLVPILVPKTSGPAPITWLTSQFMIEIKQWGILPEMARKYDQFFSMYGYAQNMVAKPNIFARANWTYIKTKGCCVSGNVPAEALRTINNVMDSGITWWADWNNVGVYVNDNGTLRDNPIGVG